jgi:hypothetical protein
MGQTGRVIAPVLHAAKALDEDFDDLYSLLRRVKIQIGEYSTHFYSVYRIFLCFIEGIY